MLKNLHKFYLNRLLLLPITLLSLALPALAEIKDYRFKNRDGEILLCLGDENGSPRLSLEYKNPRKWQNHSYTQGWSGKRKRVVFFKDIDEGNFHFEITKNLLDFARLRHIDDDVMVQIQSILKPWGKKHRAYLNEVFKNRPDSDDPFSIETRKRAQAGEVLLNTFEILGPLGDGGKKREWIGKKNNREYFSNSIQKAYLP